MSDQLKLEIDMYANLVSESTNWLFSEGNSLRQHLRAFKAQPDALVHRNSLRRSAFHIQSEIDRLQQALDDLTAMLSDFEVTYDLGWSDHGQAQQGGF